METNNTYNSIEELAADLSFISWVRNPGPPENEPWYLMLQKEGKTEWIVDARAVVEAIAFTDHELSAGRRRRMWETIVENTSSPVIQLGQRRRRLQILGMAASFLILFVAGWWFFTSDSQVMEMTSAGQVAQVGLPDGSGVALNAASTLSYSDKRWNEERKVHLNGEAWFEVAKGERFTVHTNQGIVEVLGTTFNVFQREDQFEVRCYTGKVRVTHGSASILLEAGEQGALVDNDLMKSTFQIDPGKMWTKGYFVYNNAVLADVFKEIERQFDVSIDHQKIDGNKKYTGFFLKSNLTEALQSVCWPMRLRFTIDGKDILISEE